MIDKRRLESLAPCKRRWLIYERFVDEVIDELDAAATDHTFAAPALNDAQLLRSLISLLDNLTAAAVARDLAEFREYMERRRQRWAPPEDLETIRSLRQPYEPMATETPPENAKGTYGRYFRWVIKAQLKTGGDTTRPGVDVFLEYHRTTAILLERVSSKFARSTVLAVERIGQDLTEIARVFVGDGATITELQEISPSGSDTHKRGRSVLFLKFETAVNGNTGSHRLVYKPSDIEIDYRMCGDTSAFNLYDEQTPTLSFAEFVNARRGDSSGVPVLPTYRIMPRNPGSRLKEVRKTLPLQDSYGYIEFLSHTPKKGVDGLPSNSDALPESESDPAFDATDWLTTASQADTFYRVWGAWLAIARVLSWSDLHAENVITHKKLPYPIDLEVSFSGPVVSLFGTAAVADKRSAREYKGGQTADHADDLESGGLTGWQVQHFPIRINHDHTNRMFLANLESNSFEPTKNRIVKRAAEGGGWRMVSARDNVGLIGTSMLNTLELLEEHKDQAEILINSMSKCVARYIPQPTSGYVRALVRIASSAHTTRDWEGAAGTDGKPAWHRVDDTLGAVVLRGTSIRAENAHLLRSDEHDYKDLRNYDIPAYYHRLDSKTLYNARGHIVTTSYFPRPTLLDVLDQLKRLSTPENQKLRDDAVLSIAGRAGETPTPELITALMAPDQ